MPELAEVEYYRRQWDPGLGHKILQILVHPKARLFTGLTPKQIVSELIDSTLRSSESHGKQMLFRFSSKGWLGIHLGMSGLLSIDAPDYIPQRHDHLVIVQKKRALVLTDPRQFGRVRFEVSASAPMWWQNLPPSLLSPLFSVESLKVTRTRYRRSPIKAILLRQDLFPGIGNWMADEILWRGRLHPANATGLLSDFDLETLHREIRYVCRHALRIIGQKGGYLPDNWLTNHRWKEGGICPQTGVELKRKEIGGRTTCWSPAWQKLK